MLLSLELKLLLLPFQGTGNSESTNELPCSSASRSSTLSAAWYCTCVTVRLREKMRAKRRV